MIRMDLTPYGMPITLTPKTVITNIPLREGQRHTNAFGDTTHFVMNGVTYFVESELGEGTYGTTYKVLAPDNSMCAIKLIRGLYEEKDMVAVVNEAILQILLVHASKDTPNGPYVPFFYEIAYDPIRREALLRSQLMDNTLDHLILTSTQNELDVLLPDALTQIATALNFFGTKLKFNHRDLKGNNIMYLRSPDGNSRSYKMIDFGMSCLSWRRLKIQGGDYIFSPESCFKKSRDLAQLMYSIVKFTSHKLSTRLNRVMEGFLVASVGDETCRMLEDECPDVEEWKNTYTFMNRPNVVVKGAIPTALKKSLTRFRRTLKAKAKANIKTKACPPGKRRHPHTNRCRKIRP